MNQQKSSSRPPRIELNHDAVLIDDMSGEHEVVLLDVSQAGFRLATNELFEPGERLVLRSGRSPDTRIEIRWHRGREAGGVFIDPPPVFAEKS